MDWTFADALVDVPDDLAALHARSWDELGGPGQWWMGHERADVVREVRAARACALCASRRETLSPASVEGDHQRVTELDPDVIDVVHRLTTDAGRIIRTWAHDRIATIDAAPYAELVAVVAIVHIIDTFCDAVGVAQPEPPRAQSGEATRDLPIDLNDTTTAYVAQLHQPRLPNVRRALTIVPRSLEAFFSLVGPMYSGRAFAELRWSHRALDRPQVELLAARTSALNECFY